MTRKNLYLSLILVELIVSILFISNTEGIIFIPYLVPIASAISIFPLIFLIINKNNPEMYKIFFIALIPITLFNYIISINTNGIPTGYSDIQNNIYQYSNIISINGHILFANAPNVSYYYMLLFVFISCIASITGLNIVSIALVIPPLLSILSIGYCLFFGKKVS